MYVMRPQGPATGSAYRTTSRPHLQRASTYLYFLPSAGSVGILELSILLVLLSLQLDLTFV